MHNGTRPLALCNSAPGRPQHLGVIVYSDFMPVCSIVKTITPRCHGRPDALLHKAEGFVECQIELKFIYSKTCLKRPLKKKTKRTSDSLNEGLPIKMTREKFQRK